MGRICRKPALLLFLLLCRSSVDMLTAGTGTLTRRYCPQGPSDHPQRAGDVRMGEGQQAQGRVLREMTCDLREQLGWVWKAHLAKRTVEGEGARASSGKAQPRHIWRGEIFTYSHHLTDQRAPPAMDRPALPSIAQGLLVQA